MGASLACSFSGFFSVPRLRTGNPLYVSEGIPCEARPALQQESKNRKAVVKDKSICTEAQSRVCPHPGQTGCQKACRCFHLCCLQATGQDRQRREKASKAGVVTVH
jgi:hypothetical protein